MELSRFADIVAGMQTLAELEQRNPELARGLEKMVVEVVAVGDKAYKRLSTTLQRVIALEDAAGARCLAKLQAELADVSNHDWFKKVENICSRLHVLDQSFREGLMKVTTEKEVTPKESLSLHGLIHLLGERERD